MGLPVNKAVSQPLREDVNEPTRWGWHAWLGKLIQSLPMIRTYEETLNPASVASNTVADQNFTVTGLATSDIVYVNPPALTAGLIMCQAYVSAANTLTVRFYNTTGGAIDEAAGTWLIAAIRK